MYLKMKKTIITIQLALLCMLCFAGCSSKNLKGEQMADTIKINVEQSSDDYVPGEDLQYFFKELYSPIHTENGYYFRDDSKSLLMYWDENQKEGIPLCDRPNCRHDGEGCNAYIGFDFDRNLRYYQGYLYLAGISPVDQGIWIYRFSLDGSERKKLCRLYESIDDQWCGWFIHRGYIYYHMSDLNMTEHTNILYKISLEPNAQPTEIHRFDSNGGSYISFVAYGNYLYFQTNNYSDLDGNGFTADIHKYDIHTGEVEVVKKDAWRAYVVADNSIYYDTGEGIMAYDMETKTESLFYKTELPVYMSYDGNNFYFDNYCGLWLASRTDRNMLIENREILVVDKSGTLLDSIPMTKENSDCSFGDDYLFVMAPVISEDRTVTEIETFIYDKTQIGTGKREWRKIN